MSRIITLDDLRAMGPCRGGWLYAGMLICDGLPLAQKHIDHIRKRWSVWQAGYGVLCDIDGELYCYRRV